MNAPFRRRCWSLGAGAWLALCGAATAAGAPDAPATDLPPPAKIRDLDYGDVLFHFFQDDYFEALVRLEAARQLGRVAAHESEAELLAAGLYLSLGLHGEAARRFERLLAGSLPQSVNDRAHFYLARIGFQRGYPEQAWRSLGSIRGPLPGELEPERRLLAANVLMALGRFDEAAASLEAWTGGGDWADYARFNLGVALVRSGDPARGRLWLERVGTTAVRGEEQLALRDRANLALGFALLQERQPEPAVTALNRVRLDGPFTNRALLGLGWAEAAAARPQRALVPWLELRGRSMVDAAVQESLLAVPFAYSKLASNGQAAEQYRHAVSAYAAEATRLDESIAAIRRGGFLDAVLDAAPAAAGSPERAGWFWQLQHAPDAPHTRYLYPLLASHEFQEGLKNYRDLRIMQRNLERWSGSLQAFEEMIEARRAASATRGPRKAELLAGVDLQGLELRRELLAARLAEAVAARDVVAFATPAELAQWRQLERLSVRIDGLPAGDERDALAGRVRLLHGTLAWQLDAAYKSRRSRLSADMHDADAALREARQRLVRVEQAGEIAPRDTAGFASRVRELEQRMATLQPRVEAAAGAQERLLAGIAVRELEAQKARLGSYATQAQFALASLYDAAASGSVP